MERNDIYKDIARRTDGDIYIGVVGPVRTGKSTFISKFMDQVVLPGIDGEMRRERAIDEMPQSSAGRTIMTTEPKFIPNEAVEIVAGENTVMRVRLIDCVGYVVPTALGYIEEEMPRMVNTPWSDRPMPFDEAAAIGTKKVITEHSTIGLLVTADGSFGEIEREYYVQAEEKVAAELSEINKPFVIVLNSAYPQSPITRDLAGELEEKYGAPCIPVNCLQLGMEDIELILTKMLYQFPVKEIYVKVPSFVHALENGHWLKESLYADILDVAPGIEKISEAKLLADRLTQNDRVAGCKVARTELGKGAAYIDTTLTSGLFYTILGEKSGLEIDGEESLISIMSELSNVKKEYDKVKEALKDVEEKGYGIVTPGISEMHLESPEIIKQGGRFGVRLRASAPSIHMIRADIKTEVSPIVGSEKQSEELVKYLLMEFEEDPEMIWQSNIFGKSLHELVNEGLHSKLNHMPEDARAKLQDTLQRIVNEGSGGLICIIL